MRKTTILFSLALVGCPSTPPTNDAGAMDAGTDGGSAMPDAGGDAGPMPHVVETWVSESLDGCTYASPVWVTSQGEDFVLAIGQFGEVAGLDPDTGEKVWTTRLMTQNAGESLQLLSTPAVIGDQYVVLAWTELDGVTQVRLRQRVEVLDLSTRQISTAFAPITLAANVPTFAGTGTVAFLPRTQQQRAALLHVDVPDRTLGMVYVALASGPDEQPFHGWLFEIDMDAWQTSGAAAGLANALVTTAENNCVLGTNLDACGGGIWSAAGPLLDPPDGSGDYSIYIATGNGRQDLDVGAYANSVMRTRRGLAFNRGCDEALCADFDESNPSTACQDSCTDLFMARLPAGAPPLMPENGMCEGLSFLQCYAHLDLDLGGSSPVIVSVQGGPRVLVEPGKDGALYLFDAVHMGTLYERVQVHPFCGNATHICQADWAGTFVTRPAVSIQDGDPVVIAASLMLDDVHASGITAHRVVMQGGAPHLEPMWTVPDPATPEALQVFRDHPGRPIIAQVGGEDVAFVVEVRRDALSGSPPGYLWGVRVRDGAILTHMPITQAGQRFAVPLVHGDRLYITTCDATATPIGQIEAFQLFDR